MTDLLKPGEIGVLQNLPEGTFLRNGDLAEVIRITYDTKLMGKLIPHYIIKPIPNEPVPHGYASWGCEFHELRRLTDPDAGESLTEEKEIAR